MSRSARNNVSAQGSSEQVKHNAGVAVVVHDCEFEECGCGDHVDGWGAEESDCCVGVGGYCCCKAGGGGFAAGGRGPVDAAA